MVLAIFQAIIGLINRYIGPLQQRKIPTRKSSRGLLKAGFLPVSCEKVHHEMDGPASAVALVGTLDGFAVEISSNYLTGWGKFPFYRIRVFFNTDNLSYPMFRHDLLL